jgi:hypothetical protein
MCSSCVGASGGTLHVLQRRAAVCCGGPADQEGGTNSVVRDAAGFRLRARSLPHVPAEPCVVFTVLVFVYPLRFMFGAMASWIGQLSGLPLGGAVDIAGPADVNRLFVLYALLGIIMPAHSRWTLAAGDQPQAVSHSTTSLPEPDASPVRVPRAARREPWVAGAIRRPAADRAGVPVHPSPRRPG